MKQLFIIIISLCSLSLFGQNGGVTVSSSTSTDDGTIRYQAGDFEGLKAGTWTSLTGAGGGGVNTDAQTLSLASNIATLSAGTGGGGTINLSPYLDNTDNQSLSLTSNTLSLTSGGSVNLTPYLDNTDNQTLSLLGSSISLTNGGSVNLANTIGIWNNGSNHIYRQTKVGIGVASALEGVGQLTVKENVLPSNSEAGVFTDIINSRANTANALSGIRFANFNTSTVNPYFSTGIFHVGSGDTFGRGHLAFATNDGNANSAYPVNTGDSRMMINQDGRIYCGNGIPSTATHTAQFQINNPNPSTANPSFRVQNSGASKFLVTSNGGTVIGINDPDGAPTNGLYVRGDVVIGNTSVSPATGYKLSVDGRIMCEELQVQLQSAWPDYVFSENYKLKGLYELESFINKNNHLPNIPEAKVVEEEGITIGEMQRLMMEKIEELTLYTIKQQKEIDSLRSQLEMNKD